MYNFCIFRFSWFLIQLFSRFSSSLRTFAALFTVFLISLHRNLYFAPHLPYEDDMKSYLSDLPLSNESYISSHCFPPHLPGWRAQWSRLTTGLQWRCRTQAQWTTSNSSRSHWPTSRSSRPIGQHQENETKPATAPKGAFGTNTDGWSCVAGILLVCSVVTIAFVSFMCYKMRKISPSASFYGHGQIFWNALRDILILGRELIDMPRQ